ETILATETGKFVGDGTNTIVIKRTVSLTPGSYYINIDNTVFEDTSEWANPFEGIVAPDTTTWNFTTAAGADTTAPLISSRIPLPLATDVPLNTNLKITFDEVVFVDTGNIDIYETGFGVREQIDVTSSQVTGSWTDTITVDPADFPAVNTDYWVQIDTTAFYDISGNYFAGIGDASWSFQTGSSADTTAPTATLSPLDDATDVLLVSDLTLNFNEPVYADSGNISIYKSDDTLVEQIDLGSAQVTGLGTANITITPSSDFDGSTDYYIQVDSTAFKDIANNYFAGISDETTWTFTTEPGVLLTDPFNYTDASGDLDTRLGSAWTYFGPPISTTKVQYDNATGLSATGYATNSGGSATAQDDSAGGGMTQGFTVGAVTDEGLMYFGFIVQRIDTTDNPDEGPGVLFYNGTTALGGVNFIAKNTPSARHDIILDDGTSPAIIKNNAKNADTHLIIIRYDFTNDTLDAWYNPDVTAAEPAPTVTIDL
ncbi:MAG: Ig-like domain-containing protein, partial [Spirochaetota bacterium]